MESNTIIGRITQDAKLITTETKFFVTFSVALDQGKDAEGKDKPAKFYSVKKFYNENPTKSMSVFTKGNIVSIVGTTGINKYQDKDGNHQAELEITADKIKVEHFYVAKEKTTAEA